MVQASNKLVRVPSSTATKVPRKGVARIDQRERVSISRCAACTPTVEKYWCQIARILQGYRGKGTEEFLVLSIFLGASNGPSCTAL